MFLDDLLDIIGDIVTLPLEIGHLVVEGGNDIVETVAQDIQNQIEGNPEQEVRTSYTVRDEADKIISRSNRRYNEAFERMHQDWNAMLQERQKVCAKREEVYRMVGKAISSRESTKLPSGRDLMPKTPPCPSIDSLEFNIGTYMGLPAAKMRMEIAEEYCQKAKEFQAEMNRCVAEIHRIQHLVKSVQNAQDEEIKMLQIIQSTYRNRSATVLKESNALLYQIAELCLKEVSDQTALRYQELLQSLERLWP